MLVTALPSTAETVRECDAEYTTKKAAIQASGQKKKDFITACRAGTTIFGHWCRCSGADASSSNSGSRPDGAASRGKPDDHSSANAHTSAYANYRGARRRQPLRERR